MCISVCLSSYLLWPCWSTNYNSLLIQCLFFNLNIRFISSINIQHWFNVDFSCSTKCNKTVVCSRNVLHVGFGLFILQHFIGFFCWGLLLWRARQCPSGGISVGSRKSWERQMLAGEEESCQERENRMYAVAVDENRWRIKKHDVCESCVRIHWS